MTFFSRAFVNETVNFLLKLKSRVALSVGGLWIHLIFQESLEELERVRNFDLACVVVEMGAAKG